MNNKYDYSEILSRAKQLYKAKQYFLMDGILSDQPIDLIAGETISKTVAAQIHLAQKLCGVPLFCSLETDPKNNRAYFVFRNLKTNTFIDAKLWHLPKSLMNIRYSFVLVWLDSPDRLEWDPEFSFPVVISKFN